MAHSRFKRNLSNTELLIVVVLLSAPVVSQCGGTTPKKSKTGTLGILVTTKVAAGGSLPSYGGASVSILLGMKGPLYNNLCPHNSLLQFSLLQHTLDASALGGHLETAVGSKPNGLCVSQWKYITPVLWTLHWSSVGFWVQFKVLLLTY